MNEIFNLNFIQYYGWEEYCNGSNLYYLQKSL